MRAAVVRRNSENFCPAVGLRRDETIGFPESEALPAPGRG